jgi:hypothetical protein
MVPLVGVRRNAPENGVFRIVTEIPMTKLGRAPLGNR